MRREREWFSFFSNDLEHFLLFSLFDKSKDRRRKRGQTGQAKMEFFPILGQRSFFFLSSFLPFLPSFRSPKKKKRKTHRELFSSYICHLHSQKKSNKTTFSPSSSKTIWPSKENIMEKRFNWTTQESFVCLYVYVYECSRNDWLIPLLSQPVSWWQSPPPPPPTIFPLDLSLSFFLWRKRVECYW